MVVSPSSNFTLRLLCVDRLVLGVICSLPITRTSLYQNIKQQSPINGILLDFYFRESYKISKKTLTQINN